MRITLNKKKTQNIQYHDRTACTATCRLPCRELDEGILQRLPDLQQEGLILAQSVVPVLDVVSQSKLDHLQGQSNMEEEE